MIRGKEALGNKRASGWKAVFVFACSLPILMSCADVNVPGARNVNVPPVTAANERQEAVNEKPDSVVYLPLGSDVLVPEAEGGQSLPVDIVGPFELRSETLAGALQIILSDYELPLAFETEEALTRTITVSNLRGPIDTVVNRVCSLADLYCSYEDGLLVVKETQTFAVSVPPIGGDTDFLSSLATGLGAIIGTQPITEAATRTIIYEATSRSAELAERYFQRLRSNTALIVFEVYIWEVGLDSDNRMGIDWTDFAKIGGAGISAPGAFPNIGGDSPLAPFSIGIPTFGDQATFSTNKFLEFLSRHGAVKTISQPQITVLSGSEATLRAADTQNYVSSFTRTIDNGEVAVSTEVDSVDTGFTMTISSSWDNSTIYANINIDLQELLEIEAFVSGEGTASEVSLGLPRTTEREVNTQVRIRPGDSLLIAGLVRENDQFNKSGPGFTEPIFPTSRTATVSNTEVVFLMKPKVIVYTDERPGAENKKSEVFVRDPDLKFEYSTEFPSGSLSSDMLNPAQ